MAYTVKRKPQKVHRERISILDKVKSDKLGLPTEAVKEGAHEVTAKLREDLGRWSRVRRVVSLKPTMGCIDCDTTGKVVCQACGGGGNQKLVWNDEVQQCPTCEGTGTVTCSECTGRGEVENAHRKKLIAILVIGGLMWAYVLFRLWGGDILPEQRSKYMAGGGGGGVTSTAPRAGAANLPGGAQPGRSTGQPRGTDRSGATGQTGTAGQVGAAGQPGAGR